MYFRLFVDCYTCFDSSRFKLLQILGVKSYLSLYDKTRRTHERNLRRFIFSQAHIGACSSANVHYCCVYLFILRKFDIISSRNGSSCFSRCFRTTDTFAVMRLTFPMKINSKDQMKRLSSEFFFFFCMYVAASILCASKKLLFNKFIECL